jgi:hypothetical protein
VLRARLNGGIRNKAARGELRRGLPVGFVWGEADGEVLLHPDEAVVTAIRTIFARFAETGSARRVWLWFQSWLFAGSDRGGERAAVMLTLIQTARLNDIDPQAWLADVLARIADHKITDLAALLPWNWRRAIPVARAA